MTLPKWHLLVDWDGDGTFESDEGVAVFHASIARGKRDIVRHDGKGFEPPQIGKGTLLLVDKTGRYDPWNAGSPIYPNFTANKPFKLQVEVNGTIYPVVRGRIQKIRRDSAMGASPVVRLDVTDAWADLNDAIYVAPQRNIYPGDAMGMILDAAGWDAALRDIDLGVDERAVWWASGETARAALHALASSDGGTLALRADGTIRFRDRHADEESIGTLTDADIFHGVRIPLPWDSVRTRVEVTAYMPSDLEGELFTYRAPVPVQGKATSEIFISPPAGTYIESVASVVFGASYDAGGAEDATSALDVTAEVLSATRLKLTIINNDTGQVYLQWATINGSGVRLTGVTSEASNDTGIALYGERTLKIDNLWLQDVFVAKDFADHYAWWLGEPSPDRALLSVVLRGNAKQFLWDVGDVITADLNVLPEPQAYRIIRMKHRWLDRGGVRVETEMLLEPKFSFTDTYWFFPTQLGVTSRFGF